MSKVTCCGTESRWVENVADKGYWFCDKCRKEVVHFNEATIERWWDEWKAEQAVKDKNNNETIQVYDPFLKQFVTRKA